MAAISSNGEKSPTGQAAEAQSVAAADHTNSRGSDMFTGQTRDALGPEPWQYTGLSAPEIEQCSCLPESSVIKLPHRAAARRCPLSFY